MAMRIAPLLITPDDHVRYGNAIRHCRAEMLDLVEKAITDTVHHAQARKCLVELDRLCRLRALLNSGKLPTTTKLFVNTLPATIRDPAFRGRTLIDSLEKARVAPSRIVIEITERLVIENYALFQETTAYFTDLGMSFAVDDVGAGYSGLESIARLKPALFVK